jgi:RNA polymerase sigma-70 factor (ECF subfamily)
VDLPPLLRRSGSGPDRPRLIRLITAVAAVHADAASADATDWAQIVALYDQLLDLRPDAVVGLNRAIAIAELNGPTAGLAELETLDTAALATYQPYHASRADLPARAGHTDEAIDAYTRVIDLTANATEQRFLEQQRAKADNSRR